MSGVWVWIEQFEGQMKGISQEMLGAGRIAGHSQALARQHLIHEGDNDLEDAVYVGDPGRARRVAVARRIDVDTAPAVQAAEQAFFEVSRKAGARRPARQDQQRPPFAVDVVMDRCALKLTIHRSLT